VCNSVQHNSKDSLLWWDKWCMTWLQDNWAHWALPFSVGCPWLELEGESRWINRYQSTNPCAGGEDILHNSGEMLVSLEIIVFQTNLQLDHLHKVMPFLTSGFGKELFDEALHAWRWEFATLGLLVLALKMWDTASKHASCFSSLEGTCEFFGQRCDDGSVWCRSGTWYHNGG